jgi:hypothetical protein
MNMHADKNSDGVIVCAGQRMANVYLHYVFDLWVHRWRLTKASGDMIVIRSEELWPLSASLQPTGHTQRARSGR